MTQETKNMSGVDNPLLLKWRQGGPSRKAKTLLRVACVSIIILLGIKIFSGAGLPQNGG